MIFDVAVANVDQLYEGVSAVAFRSFRHSYPLVHKP